MRWLSYGCEQTRSEASLVSVLRSARIGLLAGVSTVALVLGALAVPLTAAADSRPADAATPVTVSADSLPTAQINGVVWAQLIVGTTVYVGGEFTRSRPAGSAPGVNEVVRNNLLAYNLTTGVLVASFNPNVNGAVRALTVSNDGSRLFAGGAFTSVGGVSRSRVAAFDTMSGALIAGWAPVMNAGVKALAFAGTTVYMGGSFTAAGGQARARMAAFNGTTGALQPWSGTPTGGSINALAASPDGSKVVIGGSFTAYNGSSDPGYGMAATDATTGTSLPWKINGLIRNGGTQAAILSLTGSAEGLFGTGYVFGSGGNFEGTFRAGWADGSLIWVEDCHGDTYSAVPAGDKVYTTEHAHYCGNINGFEQTEPWTYHRTLAFSMDVGGTITADKHGYYNFAGTPRPNLLTFYPDINTGTFTGQGQGPWHVTANAQYLLYGGEFTIVNNKRQQGLARFAVPAIAPNKEGPRVANATFVSSAFVPSAASFVSGTARLSWKSAYDRDNENLTYEVLRDGVVVTTFQALSSDWNRPNLAFSDTGLNPGQIYSYRIRVTDPFGNTNTGGAANVTVASGALSGYAASVLADSPRSYWPLNEASGPTAFDWMSGADLVRNGGISPGAPGAILGDTSTASSFDGTAAGFAATQNAESPSNSFSVETWVKTATTQGGKIIGFGNSATGQSGGYDRHVYMDNDGRIWFGVYPGASQTINSTTSYNDGKWHQIVASLGNSGMSLSIDGKRVAQRADVTSGQDYQGFWRIGGDNLGGWPARPTSAFIAADIAQVAVYSAPLTQTQIAAHFVASGRTSPITPAPTDVYGAAVYAAAPDLYWRLGESSGTKAIDSSASGQPGTYFDSVTLGTPGLLNGTSNTAASFSSGLVSSDTQIAAPSTYALESWFRTTTTRGGKLIGFGSASTGLSDSYDRHVYMQDDGRLVFGTWTGQANTVVTDASYNDGQAHYVVAEQSSDGMALYVDGALVGTNPQTGAQGYSGYWRIGGDNTWGSSSPWFAGTLDDVAVYPHLLSGAAIAQHYSLGSATAAPHNAAPTAAFVATTDQLSVAVDASTSTDSDGTVTGFAWSWGDGSTSTGATGTHTYAAAGTYSITLTVTDNGGATDTATQSVTVTAPAPVPTGIAADVFARVVSGGLGAADLGGAWTTTGPASNYSVANGAGQLRVAAGGAGNGYLAGVSSSSTDLTVTTSLQQATTGGGSFISVIGRRVGSDDYRARVKILADGSVQLQLLRGATTLRASTIAGLRYRTNDALQVRLQVFGMAPTTIRAKVWATGTTEPTTWQLSGTDATPALQQSGSIGLALYLSGSATTPMTVAFDDLAATPVAGP
ncbi:MAG: PKD domain-containing protein [Cryobacterium sp.]|uniref:LamG-like jellyroll fold domain-containing protein n=1 Tax=unclassified Cryobacterium TaxID=2649013 RepID=UPI001A1C8D11|nr:MULTISPECIES: LamG-like jellyroll fold domain-containing protein [unclassified Cryobacterium]MCY7403833.1 PKD domain-containing protein [Cryobacterium sp.]MEC5154238.1 PKD repeat protein [Cryobacterium sp. CAN_C3]